MTDMTETIRNPILPGFNPDPSIVRVDDDYYIATSTFEWFPGVQIHHSRDLVNWRLMTPPLTRAAQLDMRGNPDSGGIWAPCLSFSDGQFWLIYTDIKRRTGAFKDGHNYLVTAPDINGPWSDPVYLNSSGFDPSLFHDDDGRKWLVNMVWDHRHQPHGDRFGGILCQEYSHSEQRLIGPVHNIYAGSDLKFTEAPHVFRRDGYYWLMVAEGGTGYDHAVTVARSQELLGPYKTDPAKHMLTAAGAPDNGLQRTGHADLVETQGGAHYMVHLCSRPLPGTRRSPLGRETAIQLVEWPKGEFPRLAHDGILAFDTVPAPDLPAHPFPPVPATTTFAPGPLPHQFQWLRTPEPDRLFSLDARPGHLRLFGRESPGSFFEHALVARRQVDFAYTAETSVEVAPTGYQQMAGLMAWYNRCQFHYLAITATADGDRVLTIFSCLGDVATESLHFPLDAPVPLPKTGAVRLGLDIDGTSLQFRYATEDDWQAIGPLLDASILSDECGPGAGGNFTGAFVGMAAHDLTGKAMPADFSYFTYRSGEPIHG